MAGHRAQGFTLIELLVALTIFAIMSAGIFTIFNSFQTVKENTDRDAQRLYEYQKAFTVIERDIRQMVARPIRDEFGTTAPALRGEDNHMEFTRAGWNRPPFVKIRRSELQRVKYIVEEGGLQRYYWKVLDRADNSLPERFMVLEGVEEVKFKYFRKTDQNEIREEFNWPVQTNAVPAQALGGQGKNQTVGGDGTACGIQNRSNIELPLVVEVTLTTPEFGELVKKYLIPMEYANAIIPNC
ncbi:MAG: type II secretion system minor pseudopilin GspJ [Ketobacteraceae bacterium]|nr:type II secretion system minor pseudopilin GspJ [Ketobacteraceae bacterium]